MTIVAAMKFDKRIVVMSDTMISNSNKPRNNVIPGRLKSIVINNWLTISYAGLSIQAIDAVRKIYNSSNISTGFTIAELTHVSLTYEEDLDFIVCSHESSCRLIKISNGKVFEGADIYWIGNEQAATELSKVMSVPQKDFNDLPDYISTKELAFKIAFSDYMMNNQCEGIGGAVIDCLCSPYGHCYNTHASSFYWDTIILGKDDSVEREKLNKTGIYHFEYHVSSTSERGQAIVGFYLDQAKVGYIYDPIHHDEAMKVANTDLSSFSKLVDDAGKVLSMNSRLNKKM